MDSFIYALVLVPALRDLLPRSGIAPDQANVGLYGGLLFAVFLPGWGFASVGGAPALLIAFIRYGVHESGRWQHRLAKLDRRWSARDAFFALFSPEYRRRTIVNAALLFISMVGLWAGSAYVPSSITYLAVREGHTAADAARIAS